VRQYRRLQQAAVHPLVLRQALLHVLNAAILETEGDTVSVLVEGDRRQAAVTVWAGPARTGDAARAAEARAADAGAADAGRNTQAAMVRQMLQVCRVGLEEDTHAGWRAVLRVKCVEPQPLLLVDDHADTADLLQRCTEGTRYRLITCPDPMRALEVAEEQQPLLILLDVMMPGMDGWEVLTRLKQQETTAAIPVYVCTVLDQAELALSLGADGFLRKPLTRQALLEAATHCSLAAAAQSEPPAH
jgi:CheY-like chemotaxis protein